MSGWTKDRKLSQQSSTTSSDSSILDLDSAYAKVDEESHQRLIRNQAAATNRKRLGRSCCCSLAVTAFVLSLLCLLMLLGMGGYMLYHHLHHHHHHHHLDDQAPEMEERDKVCMPCAHIQPFPLSERDGDGGDGEGDGKEEGKGSGEDLMRMLDVRQDGDSLTCCASTPSQYAALFKMILRRQEEAKKFADAFGNGNANDTDTHSLRTASAHLVAKPRYDEGTNVQHWKSPKESPSSHVRGGLSFNRTTLYVRTGGLYFIYCQVLYNRAPSPAEEAGAQGPRVKLASHYVKRHSVLHPASSAILLKARHSRNTGLDDRHSSYVGGLFFLHPGDALFVMVSVPELVSHDDLASFFGLFRVGE